MVAAGAVAMVVVEMVGVGVGAGMHGRAARTRGSARQNHRASSLRVVWSAKRRSWLHALVS